MINFVFFEDPRTLTEIRPIYVYQRVPGLIGAGVTAGGSAQLFATQIRAALTDRLSLIAVKDGFIDEDMGGAAGTVVSDGWAAVTAGLKYNVLRDECVGRLASVGLTYEAPWGSRRTQQSVGDGEFHLFLTGGQRLLDGNMHFLSSIGYRQPVDTSRQSTSIHWSNHLDVRLNRTTYLFTEAAWWHWTDDAGAGLPGVAGQDLFNFMSTGVAGSDLVTQTVGVKFKPQDKVELGIAWEFPVTGFQDIISSRLIVDMIFRY